MLPLSKGYSTKKTFCLKELVEEVCRSLDIPCEERAIDVSIDIPSELTVSGDRRMIRRAVEHLIEGAVAAMPNGGSLWATSASDARGVELEIADTGASLSDNDRQHAFDSSGVTHRGVSGWYMAVVRHIAEMHGGSVTAANCPEGGAAFTLRIPRPEAMEAAA